MPFQPGIFAQGPPNSDSGKDAELEWLLCLASTLQACQRPHAPIPDTVNDTRTTGDPATPEATPSKWSATLSWLHLLPRVRTRKLRAA
jgi:hypothetical protein